MKKIIIIGGGASGMMCGSLIDAHKADVLLLEKNHESKEIISLFLLSLFILGEKKSKNRINNNGYISYIKSFLGNVY